MSRIHPDAIYAALAGVAVGGVAAPLLFPMAAGLKTASYLASITAAAGLAYGHEAGGFKRSREQYSIVQESNREIFIQQQASREALALRRVEVDELVQTLVMLDELTPVEQRHFLTKLGLPELFELYQPALPPASEPVALQPVEVPIQVKEPEFEFVGAAQWVAQELDRAIEKAESEQSESQEDTTFDEIDVGKAVAEMMVEGDVPLNVLLACPPRTGKTTLVTTTLAWLWKLTEGRATVAIRNGKENVDAATGKLKDDFLGLAYDPRFYQAVETNEEGAKFAAFYKGFAASMKAPRSYPDLLICDEFNNLRAAAKRYDSENDLKGSNSKLQQIDNDTDLLVTQGTSRRKFCIYTSHSSYVSAIGLNRSYQDGLYTIVLGRGAAMDAIFKSLDGSMAIVRNKTLAKKLMSDFQQWLNSPKRDQDKVVVLTNLIGGNYGLYFAKYVDTSKLRFDAVPTAQSDPYEVWDEVYEDEFGNQPEAEIPPESGSTRDRLNKMLRDELLKSQPSTVKPSTIPNESPLALLLVNLRSWIASLPEPPDDAQLAAKLLEITGQKFDQDAINGLKGELGIGGDADEPTPKPQPQVGAKELATNSRFSPEYQEYLKSAEWQQRRERIKPKICAGCHGTDRLQLHHRIYPPKGSSLEAFINQSDSEFSWLCEPCHKALTASIRNRRKAK